MNQRSSSHRRALTLVAAIALAVGAVTTLGYVGFLLGPPAVGLLAHASSLLASFAAEMPPFQRLFAREAGQARKQGIAAYGENASEHPCPDGREGQADGSAPNAGR